MEVLHSFNTPFHRSASYRLKGNIDEIKVGPLIWYLWTICEIFEKRKIFPLTSFCFMSLKHLRNYSSSSLPFISNVHVKSRHSTLLLVEFGSYYFQFKLWFISCMNLASVLAQAQAHLDTGIGKAGKSVRLSIYHPSLIHCHSKWSKKRFC